MQFLDPPEFSVCGPVSAAAKNASASAFVTRAHGSTEAVLDGGGVSVGVAREAALPVPSSPRPQEARATTASAQAVANENFEFMRIVLSKGVFKSGLRSVAPTNGGCKRATGGATRESARRYLLKKCDPSHQVWGPGSILSRLWHLLLGSTSPSAPQTITLDGYSALHRAVREMKTDGVLPENTTLRFVRAKTMYDYSTPQTSDDFRPTYDPRCFSSTSTAMQRRTEVPRGLRL